MRSATRPIIFPHPKSDAQSQAGRKREGQNEKAEGQTRRPNEKAKKKLGLNLACSKRKKGRRPKPTPQGPTRKGSPINPVVEADKNATRKTSPTRKG